MPSKSKAPPDGAGFEDAVRQRAYYLWEAEGRPDGQADRFWLMAAAAVNDSAAKRAAAAAPAKKTTAKPAKQAKPAKKRAEA